MKPLGGTFDIGGNGCASSPQPLRCPRAPPIVRVPRTHRSPPRCHLLDGQRRLASSFQSFQQARQRNTWSQPAARQHGLSNRIAKASRKNRFGGFAEPRTGTDHRLRKIVGRQRPQPLPRPLSELPVEIADLLHRVSLSSGCLTCCPEGLRPCTRSGDYPPGPPPRWADFHPNDHPMKASRLPGLPDAALLLRRLAPNRTKNRGQKPWSAVRQESVVPDSSRQSFVLRMHPRPSLRRVSRIPAPLRAPSPRMKFRDTSTMADERIRMQTLFKKALHLQPIDGSFIGRTRGFINELMPPNAND